MTAYGGKAPSWAMKSAHTVGQSESGSVEEKVSSASPPTCTHTHTHTKYIFCENCFHFFCFTQNRNPDGGSDTDNWREVVSTTAVHYARH